MSRSQSSLTHKLTVSALCLALCLLLPFLTGQIQQIGNALCPMHIPVFLCGFLCGAPWGAAVGLIAPPLRFLLFHMPPIFPIGVAMSFELAVYGLVAGLLYARLPKRVLSLYVSLLGAMLAGRAVWGIVRFALAAAVGEPFTFAMFLSGAFLTAIPGIVCHLLLIPPVVIALRGHAQPRGSA